MTTPSKRPVLVRDAVAVAVAASSASDGPSPYPTPPGAPRKDQFGCAPQMANEVCFHNFRLSIVVISTHVTLGRV